VPGPALGGATNGTPDARSRARHPDQPSTGETLPFDSATAWMRDKVRDRDLAAEVEDVERGGTDARQTAPG